VKRTFNQPLFGDALVTLWHLLLGDSSKPGRAAAVAGSAGMALSSHGAGEPVRSTMCPRHELDRWTVMVQARPFLSPFVCFSAAAHLPTPNRITQARSFAM